MAVQANEIAATTTQHIINVETDALAIAHPAWKDMLKNKYKASGLNVQFPIKLMQNVAQAYIPLTGATVDVSPSPQLQYGVLNWKGINYNINFTLQDFAFTNGNEDKADYFSQKINGAMKDYVRLQAQSLVQGTMTTGALGLDGFFDMVAASGTAYAGLLDTDYAANGLSPYLPFFGTDTTVNYAAINKLITGLKARMQQDGESVRDMVGYWNAAVQQAFLNSAQAQQRFYEEKELSSGFEGIKVNGVNFYLDENMAYTTTSGTPPVTTDVNSVIIFPKSIMKLAHVFGLGERSPFDGEIQLPNQPIKSAQHYSVLNAVCTNRRLIAFNNSLVA